MRFIHGLELLIYSSPVLTHVNNLLTQVYVIPPGGIMQAIDLRELFED